MASAAISAGSASPPRDEAQLPVANHMLLIVGIMGASLLQVLDTTIANVAIPHMQSALGATAESVTWVLTSYIIASAVALPITGWLADRIGARRLFGDQQALGDNVSGGADTPVIERKQKGWLEDIF